MNLPFGKSLTLKKLVFDYPYCNIAKFKLRAPHLHTVVLRNFSQIFNFPRSTQMNLQTKKPRQEC